MLRRIKWAQDPSGVSTGGGGGADGDDDDDDEDNGDGDDDDAAAPAAGAAGGASASAASTAAAGSTGGAKQNRCILVWEGTVKEPTFRRDFRIKKLPLEQQARDLLKRYRVEHYWDFAKNYVDKDY